MKLSTFLMMMLAAALLMVCVTGCDREITRIEQVAADPNSCFECHNDTETPLVAAREQWNHSVHASAATIDRNYSSCVSCHISEGFIDRITGSDQSPYSNPTAIHCFTCHAPHTTGDFALRVDDPQTLENDVSEDIGAGNLCVACHHARRGVDAYVGPGDETLSEHWGPHHSVQGDMLFGSNGYEYAGYEYEDTYYHRTMTENGCVDCHFDFTQNYVVGGHSFNMVGEDGGEPLYNTGACESCHEDFDTDEIEGFNYEGIQEDTHNLAMQLEGLLETAGLLHDGHPVEDFVASADSSGALWNYLMYEEDRSGGVHNPDYLMGLLESAVMFMEGDLPQDTKAGPIVSQR